MNYLRIAQEFNIACTLNRRNCGISDFGPENLNERCELDNHSYDNWSSQASSNQNEKWTFY